MSTLSQATDVAGLLIEGLDTIARITGSVTAQTAEEALVAIRAVITALEKATTGSITPDAVRGELAALEQAIASNDARADASLTARFDHDRDDGEK